MADPLPQSEIEGCSSAAVAVHLSRTEHEDCPLVSPSPVRLHQRHRACAHKENDPPSHVVLHSCNPHVVGGAKHCADILRSIPLVRVGFFLAFGDGCWWGLECVIFWHPPLCVWWSLWGVAFLEKKCWCRGACRGLVKKASSKQQKVTKARTRVQRQREPQNQHRPRPPPRTQTNHLAFQPTT